jgi:hypothetical protein
VNPITLSWETWRAVIAVLREKGLPYMLEHANVIEEQLEQHGPGEPIVRLSLTAARSSILAPLLSSPSIEDISSSLSGTLSASSGFQAA